MNNLETYSCSVTNSQERKITILSPAFYFKVHLKHRNYICYILVWGKPTNRNPVPSYSCFYFTDFFTVRFAYFCSNVVVAPQGFLQLMSQIRRCAYQNLLQGYLLSVLTIMYS